MQRFARIVSLQTIVTQALSQTTPFKCWKIWPQCQMSCRLGFKLDITSCQIDSPTFLMGGKLSRSWKLERSIQYMIAIMGWLMQIIYHSSWLGVESTMLIQELALIFSLQKWETAISERRFLVRFLFNFLKIYFRVYKSLSSC